MNIAVGLHAWCHMADEDTPQDFIKDDCGDWLVDVEPDHDEYIHIQFSEMDEQGIDVKDVYMHPQAALDFANAIRTIAQERIS